MEGILSQDHGVSPREQFFNLTFEPDGDKVTVLMPFDSYAFGGEVIDRSGFENHAHILTGDPEPRLGKFGGAMQFNGTSDIIAIPDNLKLRFVGTTGFTFSCWFLPRDISFLGTVNEPIARRIACKTDDAFNGWSVAITPHKRVVFAVRSAAAGGAYQWVQSPPLITRLNVWYHLTCVWNNTLSTPSTTIYLNNVASTQTSEFLIVNNSEDDKTFYIGGRDATLPGGNNAYFHGRIDNVRYYRDKPITPIQNTNLFENGYSITPAPIARVGHAYLTKNAGFHATGFSNIGYDTITIT